jgi:hypothetical protein
VSRSREELTTDTRRLRSERGKEAVVGNGATRRWRWWLSRHCGHWLGEDEGPIRRPERGE